MRSIESTAACTAGNAVKIFNLMDIEYVKKIFYSYICISKCQNVNKDFNRIRDKMFFEEKKENTLNRKMHLDLK